LVFFKKINYTFFTLFKKDLPLSHNSFTVRCYIYISKKIKVIEDRTMKRLLLITLILVTVALGGILHSGYMHHERAEEILASQEYMNHYPEPMPNVVFDPMNSISF